jgi:hypothetical protein
MKVTIKGSRWASTFVVVAMTAVLTVGCASSPAPAGDEASPTASAGTSIDPAAVQSCALLAGRVEEVGDRVADGFRVLDDDPQDALAHFEEAATSFDPAGDEWVGEAVTAAEQFAAGLDDLNATMRSSVDGTTIDVASAETAANTFTEQARDAMDACLATGRQAAS